MKLRNPAHEVTVYERGKEGAAHGWGVTMEQKFLARLADLDAETARAIERAAIRWQDQVICFGGSRDVNRDNGMAYGVSRQAFVDILAARARQLGARVRYEQEVRDPAELPEADLILAADGVNSQLRSGSPGFGTTVSQGRNKYIWLGTSRRFDAFHFFFEPTPAGWIWAYAYPHAPTASTFVVECTPATWAGLGFEDGQPGDTLDRLERIFAAQLDGHPLTARFPDGTEARWLNFRTVSNERWHQGRVVLAGDSAHTAHFSVGLGTTLAMDDVIALADHLGHGAGPGGVAAASLTPTTLTAALRAYQAQRQDALRQSAMEGRRSATWFENMPRYAHLSPGQFATVLHSRRAPLLPHLPPRLFCGLHSARQRLGPLNALRALAG
jgi:2-polyprenyl-6-methoxyphenol hydroxylase-like FAD-dependent oxidoreductase